ncbi:dihydrofolate reductase family protein [Methanobacterium sp.]|uniref:dihydrofolate reductase family protein n=1 Tax=Methanobacterium sp. TaxID=2164 RepID=UPI003C749F72
MIPKVIIFNNMSLDGRIDGFDIDNELYYHLAKEWSLDAVLMSNNVVLKKFQLKHGKEGTDHKGREVNEIDNLPLLVVPDSKGSIRIWDEVLESNFYRDILVLCSRSTTQEYLDFLEERSIKYMIIGYNEVNLSTALEELNVQLSVKNLRVESGGKLNGLLLRDDLVDEVCVLIYPNLVGGISPDSIYSAPDLNSKEGVLDLKLLKMKKLKNEIILLHYRIMKYQF